MMKADFCVPICCIPVICFPIPVIGKGLIKIIQPVKKIYILRSSAVETIQKVLDAAKRGAYKLENTLGFKFYTSSYSLR